MTGARGFLGGYVVSELAERGVPATLLTRSPSLMPNVAPNHDVVELDINVTSSNVYDTMGRPDVLIHLAWSGLPNYQSLHHIEDELPSQYRFLRDAVLGGLRNLLVSGTCFEYGMRSGSLREDLEARPANAYAVAKNTLHTQLEFLQRDTNFSLTWARLFYLYGRGQAPTSLFSQLTAAVEHGDRRFAMSGGQQIRDYLPVEEAARYLVTIALNEHCTGIVNICSGVPISVQRLVEKWIIENGWSIELQLGAYPYVAVEPMEFWGDRTTLDQCLRTGAPA